jgi:chromosome segregation ATPase
MCFPEEAVAAQIAGGMMRGSGHKPGRFEEDSMKRTEYSSVSARLLGVALVVAAVHAPAAAQSDTKTLSGKSSGSGKVMTREELRACMKQQQTLATRKSELESRQAALTSERAQIQTETDAIKADQGALTSDKGQVDALNERIAAFQTRAKALQDRREEFDRLGRSGPAADRERRVMDKEALDLKKEETDINAAREGIVKTSQSSADKLNARVQAQQDKAQRWNDESKKLSTEQQAYEDERIGWIDNCGNRRYREDDEKAIKAGK